MASNSLARPRKVEIFSVFSQRADLVCTNSTLWVSFLKASTEPGSNGAWPPFGEAMVSLTCGERT